MERKQQPQSQQQQQQRGRPMSSRSTTTTAALALLVSLSSSTVHGWTGPSSSTFRQYHHSSTTTSTTTTTRLFAEPLTDESTTTTIMTTSFTNQEISNLRYRELHNELQARDLSTDGTTGQLRNRLREALGLDTEECVVNEDGMNDDCVEPTALEAIVDFVDESDPDYEIKSLQNELEDKISRGHWKAATRKLKKWTRRYSQYDIPLSILEGVLEVCLENRVQGARASEPARKVMEQMIERGHAIPEMAGNYAIKNSLGKDLPGATHQGFGGIDTALAMVAAMEQSQTPIQLETNERLIVALAQEEGSIPAALERLRSVVVDQSETPSLTTLAAVAQAIVAPRQIKKKNKNGDEAAPVETKQDYTDQILVLLTLSKAAGFELDSIAATYDGRSILAAGIVAAERLDNLGLGLRLLTAAANKKDVLVPSPTQMKHDDEDEEPEMVSERGDVLVASFDRATQRACTLLHKQAINKAVEDAQWKLAVRLLELMVERGLRPSPWIWRNVVACCAKAEKSRKSTALLLDWVKLYELGKADMPSLSVFNTVVNACEICDEQELTLMVLDTMKKTHDTDGNIITFNIALKRLARQGNTGGCEGIIIGMLQAGVEPTVVSYTTAIASCVSDPNAKQPKLAYEWLNRMRSRRVNPNILTYNTALASCLDGTLESTILSSKMAVELKTDLDRLLSPEEEHDAEDYDQYHTVIPDASTRFLARRLADQLDALVEAGDINERVADETVRPALKAIFDFDEAEADVARAREMAAREKRRLAKDEDETLATSATEMALEYSDAASTHRTAEV